MRKKEKRQPFDDEKVNSMVNFCHFFIQFLRVKLIRFPDSVQISSCSSLYFFESFWSFISLLLSFNGKVVLILLLLSILLLWEEDVISPHFLLFGPLPLYSSREKEEEEVFAPLSLSPSLSLPPFCHKFALDCLPFVTFALSLRLPHLH